MCLSHQWETETAVISAQHKQHKSSVVEFCYKLQNWEEKGQLQDVYHLMPYIETVKKTSQTISFTCLHNSYRHLGTLKFRHPAWAVPFRLEQQLIELVSLENWYMAALPREDLDHAVYEKNREIMQLFCSPVSV